MIVAQWGMWVTKPNQSIELFVLVAQLLYARFTSLKGDPKDLKPCAWMIATQTPTCAWGVNLDPTNPSSVAAFKLRSEDELLTREQFYDALGAPVPIERTTESDAPAQPGASGRQRPTLIVLLFPSQTKPIIRCLSALQTHQAVGSSIIPPATAGLGPAAPVPLQGTTAPTFPCSPSTASLVAESPDIPSTVCTIPFIRFRDCTPAVPSVVGRPFTSIPKRASALPARTK